ncbi:MAG TPA: hypothetical protein VLA15_09510, partial [Desulfurivibrionaceae bacterium]|nr:hypothetical protein [Desulfurivibrionaceae bacterium]
MLAVAVRPENPELMWAAYYASGGVITSRDGGQTWAQAAEGLAGQPVFDLLITRAAGGEPPRVWAATRAGLFWRDETGKRWQPVAEGLPPLAVFALATDANGRLYLGLDGAGIYAETDSESGWESLTLAEPLVSASVLALTVSPDGRQFYIGTSGQGLWASRDAGRTWTSAYPGEYVANVAFNPADPTAAVASLRDRLVQTLDGGQTWRTLAVPWDREWTVSLLWLADGSLKAGTARGRFYQSRDNGDSWSGGTTDLPPHGVLDLAGAGATRLLAGSWVGLYDSRDGGQSWQALTPMDGSPNNETLLATEQGLLLGGRTGLYRWATEEKRWVVL